MAFDIRGIHAHQNLAEGDVGFGQRPEERLLIGHTRRAYGEAADYVLTGGRRCDDGLVGLLTGWSQLRHSVVAEGTDDCKHVFPVSQCLAEPCEVFRQLVMPFQLQLNTQCVVQLCLVQVVEEPLCRPFKPCLCSHIGTRRCHHGHRLLHPSPRLLIDDGVIPLPAAYKQHHA